MLTLLSMPITLSLQHDVQSTTQPSQRAMAIAVMFGLSIDQDAHHTIIPPTRLTLAPRQILFLTGISGGGKSTLLHLIGGALKSEASPCDAHPPGLVWTDRLPMLADAALVDALARPEGATSAAKPAELDTVCRWLSLAGLNDARVMLRRPRELSEGQRHRLQLAQAIAMAERQPEPWSVLLADEFGSTLDRTTAYALARSVRRWVSKTNICLVAATAHDDLLEPLAPDGLVEVEPGGRCAVHVRAK